jgi:hypothetical protein
MYVTTFLMDLERLHGIAQRNTSIVKMFAIEAGFDIFQCVGMCAQLGNSTPAKCILAHHYIEVFKQWSRERQKSPNPAMILWDLLVYMQVPMA